MKYVAPVLSKQWFCGLLAGALASTACSDAGSADADGLDPTFGATDGPGSGGGDTAAGESEGGASGSGGTSGSGGETSGAGGSDSGGTTDGDTGGGTDGGSGMGADGCGDALATGISLRRGAAFQVVGIPLFEGPDEIDTSERTADIVADRELALRLDVDVDPDWQPRLVSVRVELEREGGATEVFYAKTRVTGSTAAEDPSTRPVVEVPAEWIGQDTTYSVSLVECEDDAPTLTEGLARFPTTGRVALGPRTTGPIKIHIVPFRVAGFVPETNDSILEGFAAAVRAMYPTPEVILTVGDVFDDGDAVDMGSHLVRLGQLRDSDGPPADVYYYGLISGAATRDEFCGSCSTGTSEEAGQTHVGFAVGAAFGDRKSESTLVHELGHMHGRKHAPCGGPNLLDDGFPYPGADITVEGYDYRTGNFIPATHKDVMGYCEPRWVSDYTYRAFTEWVARWNP